MSKIWMPAGGSGSSASDECTAGKDKVLSGYTAITKDSGDEPAAGTMTNQGAVSQVLNAGGSYTIPAGYHNGSGKVTANSLSSQTGGATAGDGDVLNGKTYWKDGAKRTGTMTNQGTKTSALNAGGSYTIPAGYHNGSGKVTANSLSSQTGATATAAQILSGQTAWVNGSKLTGSMANQGTKTSALNCGGSYTIPAGYHNGSGKVTANSLASQTSATAAAGNLVSGKTAWVNGAKITGTLSIQSAISFSAAALSYDTIRISWKNPAKGPWQGVFIQMSTSGNPGTGGGSRVYTGAGTNPNQANGNNYVDIGGLSPNTQYYFTCTSYCDALGWGTSHNVNYRTQDLTIYGLFTNGLVNNTLLPIVRYDSDEGDYVVFGWSLKNTNNPNVYGTEAIYSDVSYVSQGTDSYFGTYLHILRSNKRNFQMILIASSQAAASVLVSLFNNKYRNMTFEGRSRNNINSIMSQCTRSYTINSVNYWGLASNTNIYYFNGSNKGQIANGHIVELSFDNSYLPSGYAKSGLYYVAHFW